MFIILSLNFILRNKRILISDVPDPGSGQIRPLFAEIRIRPDLNLKKISGSGSGRISIWKKDSDPVPAGTYLRFGRIRT